MLCILTSLLYTKSNISLSLKTKRGNCGDGMKNIAIMLFAALTNSVCLNNASFFFLFKYFLCQGYELSGEIALKNNHYYYYYYYY